MIANQAQNAQSVVDKVSSTRILKVGDDFVINGDARNLDSLLSYFQRYQIIYADPPWKYADQRKERKDGSGPTRGIGACHHYGLLSMDDIRAIPVDRLAADRCHLYMWATMPLLPDALSVMKSWHFGYATVAYCWVKLNTKLELFSRAYNGGWDHFGNELIDANHNLLEYGNVIRE